MKKLTLIISALALLIGMSQCTKQRPEMPHYSGSVGDMYIQHVTVNASHGSGNSKVTGLQIGTELKLKWQTGDKLHVYNQTHPEMATEPLTLKGEGGSNEGQFEGNISGATGDNLTFYYKGSSAVVECNEGAVTYAASNFLDQDGALDGDNGIFKRLFIMKKDVAFPLGSGTLELKVPYAIFKFDLKALGTAGGNTVTISADGSTVVSVTGVTNAADNPYYVAVPANGTYTEYAFSGNGKTAKTTWKIDANVFYTNKDEVGAAIVIEPPFATIVTIPVCAVHKNCASSGGVVTGKGVDEQGVCWSTSAYPTISDNKYIHQYEYATGSLTPKNTSTNNTFTGFMSGLTANTEYHVRAYIKKGNQVVYGNDETFTTPSTESFPTTQTVNFGLTEYPSLEWSKYNLGVDPTNLDHAADWYGDYYMWGDNAACTGTTSGKTVDCGWQSYRYAANSTTTFTKYCPTGSTSYWYSGAGSPDRNLNFADCTYADDCVRQTLGGAWRMPTGGAVNTTTGAGEWQALYNGTLWVWTDHYNGITNLKGYVVYKVKADAHKKQRRTSDGVKNGGYAGYSGSGYTYTLDDTHMFLPAAGYREGTSLKEAGTRGRYWSSHLYSDRPDYAWYIGLDSGNVDPQSKYTRYRGKTVRPVQ